MLSFPSMNSALAKRSSNRHRQRRPPVGWRCRRRGRRAHGWQPPSPISRSPIRRGSTLLELVQAVQQEVTSDVEVVAVVRWLVNSGVVVLTGTFAGQRL